MTQLRLFSKENNTTKISVALIGIAMLFVVLFSAVFVSVESIHDCDGNDCPICAVIMQCENNLEQLGVGITGLAIAFFAVVLFASLYEVSYDIILYSTPVSKMVRMNN